MNEGNWHAHLAEAQNKQSIVSLYTDEADTCSFLCGFVQGLSESHVIVGGVSRFGLYDGYITRELEDILMVEVGNNYCSRIHQLYNLQL